MLHRGDLGPRPGAGCGSPAEPGPAHRDRGAAGHGPGPERELRRLSSRAEHGTLVGPTRRPTVVAPAGRRLCPARAGRHRSRRHDRAPLGNQDQGARHLSGPGPLQSRPLCQGERSALALRHAAGTHSLGRLRLGAAVPDPPGALRTLRPKPRPAAQDADRLGPPGAAPDRPLAARPADRRGRRQQLLGHRVAALRQPASGCGHPAAARCRSVLTPPAAPAGSQGPPARQRSAPADPEPAGGGSSHRVAAGRDPGLVRQHPLDVATGTALWHHPGRRVLIRWVLVRDPEGGREPQAFLCTDLMAEPTAILGWFVRRWRVEVTFAEVRRHLGVETQRQWSDLAILRTTPALLGLFSLVTLWADRIKGEPGIPLDRVRWYPKADPTFSDALALVRRELWTSPTFATSPDHRESAKNTDRLLNRLIRVACNPP